MVGVAVGAEVGAAVGSGVVGTDDGPAVGCEDVGARVGDKVGSEVGSDVVGSEVVGSDVMGLRLGAGVGVVDGDLDGAAVGGAVGDSVQRKWQHDAAQYLVAQAVGLSSQQAASVAPWQRTLTLPSSLATASTPQVGAELGALVVGADVVGEPDGATVGVYEPDGSHKWPQHAEHDSI